MLTDFVIELARNIFGAGGGSTHPTVASAALYAYGVGEMLRQRGVTGDELHDATNRAFTDALGWTQEEGELYWKNFDRNPYAMTDSSVDAFDEYVKWARDHQPELNAAIMRGDKFRPWHEPER